MILEVQYTHKQKIESMLDIFKRYSDYKNDLLYNLHDPEKLSQVLDSYLNYVKHLEKSGEVTSRQAVYSSILEEHPVLIFENFIRDNAEKLEGKFYLGSYDCIVCAGADVKCKMRYETKKIDFAFGFSNNSFPNPILLVGFEVKKYIDKTMFDSIVATHEQLREFRPRTFYGFLGEDEARSKETIQNSKLLDKEFILTNKTRNKDDRNPIDIDIYKKWYLYTMERIKESIVYMS